MLSLENVVEKNLHSEPDEIWKFETFGNKWIDIWMCTDNGNVNIQP